MKRHSLLIVSLLIASIYLLAPGISPAHAQDAPNTNVTKRRPDRTVSYSPSPAASAGLNATQPEIKQVQTDQASFLSVLWARITAFFAKIFQLPQASSTTSSS